MRFITRHYIAQFVINDTSEILWITCRVNIGVQLISQTLGISNAYFMLHFEVYKVDAIDTRKLWIYPPNTRFTEIKNTW